MENTILMPAEKRFYANNGETFSSLQDLFDAIPEMEDETFSYHLNKDKNDYYNWVKDVLGDKEFADSIKKVKTKTGFLRKIKAYQKQLKQAA